MIFIRLINIYKLEEKQYYIMGKIIKITEAQFHRLFEETGDSEFLDGNDTTHKFGSEVSNQAIINGKDGEEKYSNPVDTDKFAKQQTPQQWGTVGGRNSSNTI